MTTTSCLMSIYIEETRQQIRMRQKPKNYCLYEIDYGY